MDKILLDLFKEILRDHSMVNWVDLGPGWLCLDGTWYGLTQEQMDALQQVRSEKQ